MTATDLPLPIPFLVECILIRVGFGMMSSSELCPGDFHFELVPRSSCIYVSEDMTCWKHVSNDRC